MATLVSERSALNPNAPLFIPNVYRQVEDFSPEWWELVKTSSWFSDFWLSQHPEGCFDGSDGADDDLMNLLPEDLDAGIEEEFPNLEAQFEEMVMLAEAEEKTDFSATDPKVEMKPLNGNTSCIDFSCQNWIEFRLDDRRVYIFVLCLLYSISKMEDLITF
ncbi:protein EARLY RESPONSIVE TO DEHYDRATION [Salix suchowensis]|nr:protein EARLY RESPONSIVE TO DEHYDRATION [Salix suchowensis]